MYIGPGVATARLYSELMGSTPPKLDLNIWVDE